MVYYEILKAFKIKYNLKKGGLSSKNFKDKHPRIVYNRYGSFMGSISQENEYSNIKST